MLSIWCYLCNSRLGLTRSTWLLCLVCYTGMIQDLCAEGAPDVKFGEPDPGVWAPIPLNRSGALFTHAGRGGASKCCMQQMEPIDANWSVHIALPARSKDLHANVLLRSVWTGPEVLLIQSCGQNRKIRSLTLQFCWVGLDLRFAQSETWSGRAKAWGLGSELKTLEWGLEFNSQLSKRCVSCRRWFRISCAKHAPIFGFLSEFPVSQNTQPWTRTHKLVSLTLQLATKSWICSWLNWGTQAALNLSDSSGISAGSRKNSFSGSCRTTELLKCIVGDIHKLNKSLNEKHTVCFLPSRTCCSKGEDVQACLFRPSSHRMRQHFCALCTQLQILWCCLRASCVNTPIEHSVFHYLRVPVARCSASCVNWA